MIARGRIDVGPRKGKRRERIIVAGTDARADRRARQLALAHWIERKIEAGELRNYAHAAAVLGVSRARVSQIVGMLARHVSTAPRWLEASGPEDPERLERRLPCFTRSNPGPSGSRCGWTRSHGADHHHRRQPS